MTCSPATSPSDVNNDALLDACKGDGTAYMYPLSSAPFYMGLNKEMLEKANALQYVNMDGDRTWTTDNFVKMWTRCGTPASLRTPGIVYCGGQGGDQGTRALVNNLYSSTIIGTDGKWNIDAKGIKALTLLQTLVNNKISMPACPMSHRTSCSSSRPRPRHDLLLGHLQRQELRL
jgi:multiple sugar transport system substrate-binding protein